MPHNMACSNGINGEKNSKKVSYVLLVLNTFPRIVPTILAKYPSELALVIPGKCT